MPLVAYSRRPLSLATAERSVSFLLLFLVLWLSLFSSQWCCCLCVRACGDSCQPTRRTPMPSSRSLCSSRYERPLLCRVSYLASQRPLFSTDTCATGYFGQCLSLRLPSHFSGRSAHKTETPVMTTSPDHGLQRTRHERRGCNPHLLWAGSLSLGR